MTLKWLNCKQSKQNGHWEASPQEMDVSSIKYSSVKSSEAKKNSAEKAIEDRQSQPKAVVLKAWKSISKQDTKGLDMSLSHWLDAIIASMGHATKY